MLRLQFSLRMLLLFTAIVALCLTFWAMRNRQFGHEVTQVRKLRRLCNLSSEYSYVFLAGSKSRFHTAVHDSVGDWFAGRFPSLRVLEVGIFPEKGKLAHAEVAISFLSQFDSLNKVCVSGSDFNDVMLETLAESCPRVQELDLSDTAITDESSSFISCFTALEVLDISSTKLSGDNFEAIGDSCESLRELYARDTPLSKHGVYNIAKFTSLEMLYITCGNCFDMHSLEELMQELRSLPHWQVISIDSEFGNFVLKNDHVMQNVAE